MQQPLTTFCFLAFTSLNTWAETTQHYKESVPVNVQTLAWKGLGYISLSWPRLADVTKAPHADLQGMLHGHVNRDYIAVAITAAERNGGTLLADITVTQSTTCEQHFDCYDRNSGDCVSPGYFDLIVTENVELAFVGNVPDYHFYDNSVLSKAAVSSCPDSSF